MTDYSEGANHCVTNSKRLEASATILLNDSNGTDSFGLFLYYISYEELAKAVYCLFVHQGWVNEEFIKPVFDDHGYKIFLYDEIIDSFEKKDGVFYLGGEILGTISLTELIKKHKPSIRSHRNTTNDFLYVGKNSKWKIPKFSETDKENLEYVKNRISALHNFLYFFDMEHDKNFKNLSNFRFERKGDGSFSMSVSTENN